MANRSPKTTRDDLTLQQAPASERGLLQWVGDFLTSLQQSFRLHAHLFPAVLAGELQPKTYTVATLPPAADVPSAIVYVSDGAAGAKFRGSDGAAWVNLG